MNDDSLEKIFDDLCEEFSIEPYYSDRFADDSRGTYRKKLADFLMCLPVASDPDLQQSARECTDAAFNAGMAQGRVDTAKILLRLIPMYRTRAELLR